jgi:A/G-specific adenine glycosylase
MGPVRRGRIQEAVISWFENNARDLPWRRTRDPWHVLVSEVMLQQIQVRRAIPFYERFLARFPTVESLAAAPLAEAIRVWEDLGRYRRIVYLHDTARIVMGRYEGRIPSDPNELIKLPGIGPYTAGAVACFAYERDAIFLDTNMRRVLRRYFFGLQAATPATDKELMTRAMELVPPQRGWRWNQALMETGALVCTSRKPRCEECPLGDDCRARTEASAGGWPKPERKAAAHRYEETNRFFRGKVLAELRRVSHAGSGGIALRELGRRVGQDFDEKDPSWLFVAVESLCRDGLAKVSDEPTRAKTPGMVEEERAPYGGGSEEAPSFLLDRVVSLP